MNKLNYQYPARVEACLPQEEGVWKVVLDVPRVGPSVKPWSMAIARVGDRETAEVICKALTIARLHMENWKNYTEHHADKV